MQFSAVGQGTLSSNVDTVGSSLTVSGLGVSFDGHRETVRDVSLNLVPGEIFGIVGESGCGKSITCRALMGLLPRKAVVTGTLAIAGQTFDLSDQKQLKANRGRILSMIFQDPMSALNPLMTVQRHLTLHLERNGQPSDIGACQDLLRISGMSDPERFLRTYPHQMSGGQCQRVAIAIALAGQPDVLIADEPTTALDVILQAQILDELVRISARTSMSIILISHDIGLIGKYCSRAAVMYAGEVVETGAVHMLLHQPGHPYTRGLINSLPLASRRGQMLAPIDGNVPKPGAITQGCVFAPRCSHCVPKCRTTKIPMQTSGARHMRCLLPLSRDAA